MAKGFSEAVMSMSTFTMLNFKRAFMAEAARGEQGEVKAGWTQLAEKVGSSAAGFAGRSRDLIQSGLQGAIRKAGDFVSKPEEEKASPLSELEKNRERFKAALGHSIDIRFAEIMKGKGENEKFLTYVDGQILSASVRKNFLRVLELVPPKVEAACRLSEVVLAPSAQERIRLLKGVIGIGGGSAGIGMILAAVGGALGWGAGALAHIGAVLTGVHLAGPIGLGVAGATVAGIAVYFAATSNKQLNTERFMNALKKSCSCAIDEIWAEYGTELLQAISRDSSE